MLAHYSAPASVTAALERIKAEGHRRERVRELVTRARGGLLHNYTVKEIAAYFRAAERGRVDLRQVAEATGIPISDTRQVLREFVIAGLLIEYEQPDGEQVRRLYELADNGQEGITEVFIEAEAAARERRHSRKTERWLRGLGWGRAR
ncbi:hypothetical protein ACIPY6_43655 [Streptomyces sp. NPDC090054]|uniref:hypothetical protein n=1 Tax=Streptomyces sp. NPDC090054 TaxID=3365933 RepID=UPI0037FE2F8A